MAIPELTHPSTLLDDLVHQRVRLGVLAVLAEADRADFNHLRDTLGVTDGNLSRHLSVLVEAGYVEINRTFEGKRPRSWVVATREGRKALGEHLSALREIIDKVGESG